MLSAKPQMNLANAREYFREHLRTGDYYSASQQVAGEWIGQGAAKLGLSGVVKEADFLALCEGRHPETGARLTARLNGNRQEEGRSVANRRVFYDFTLSPPKSVSVVALVQDDRILAVHDRAVKETMRELERFAETRVRIGGANTERITGNVVAATFRHDTSRALDPHLHTHCVVFNATFDADEKRWKALQVHGMFHAQKFAENLYYHELSKGLRGLGYEIENTGRDFEIKGVTREVIASFSKRHQQIDAETERRIKNEGIRGNVKELRAQVAESKRARKMKDSTADRLRPFWREQLSRGEAKVLAELPHQAGGGCPKIDASAALAWADENLFERRSVVREHELAAETLARGRGEDFRLEDVRAAIADRKYVREAGTDRLTSREVLGWELEVVVAAHDGRRRFGALNPGYVPAASLKPEQAKAAAQILASRDFVTLFRGGAGTGKSYTLKEIERGLVAGNRAVVVLAPQRQQVGDLQTDGLRAQTVAAFLERGEMPPRAVVMVDEAGQIGAKDMSRVLRIVRAHGGRLILSGDTRQHGAVAASDALRAIEKHAGIKPATIHEIRRQDPDRAGSRAERQFIREYRAAVEAAAKGDIAASFARLDRLSCIRECTQAERRDALAAEYRAALARKETPLVVAQTRDEARVVNELVREQLCAARKLTAGRAINTFAPVDLSEAQKRDARFYQEGHHVCFHRKYGRFTRGEVVAIVRADSTGLVLLRNGRESKVSYRYTERFSVARAQEMKVATGDRLQLKFNGTSVEGSPLSNGELVTVRRVKRNGAVVVEDRAGSRKTLAPSQRTFVRGYAVTSYGSQGKTVDTVIFADAASRAATSAEQWYVTVSRARRRVVVFTPDKEALRTSVERIGARELAVDLKPEDPDEARRVASEVRASLAAIERSRRHAEILAHVNGAKQQPRERIRL